MRITQLFHLVLERGCIRCILLVFCLSQRSCVLRTFYFGAHINLLQYPIRIVSLFVFYCSLMSYGILSILVFCFLLYIIGKEILGELNFKFLPDSIKVYIDYISWFIVYAILYDNKRRKETYEMMGIRKELLSMIEPWI